MLGCFGMNAKPVTAIIVTYNSAQVVSRALQSLARQPAAGAIIVVDNASTDGTREIVRRDFPQVQLIENAANQGFGRANNLALEQVATPYALLINPDASLHEGALAILLAAALRFPRAAILAPALYDEKGLRHESAKRNVWERERIFSPRGDTVEFLSGAVWLVNMAALRGIGFFDPNIFLYYEDDDLCLRAATAGYELAYVPEARAEHSMGTSSGLPSPAAEYFKQIHMAWSRLYIEDKYRGKKPMLALAQRQRLIYRFKAFLYFLLLNSRRAWRYRARLAGIVRYTAQFSSNAGQNS